MTERNPLQGMQGETIITATFDGLSPTNLEVPCLTIIAHPDPRRVGEIVVLTELRGNETVKLSRLEPAFAAPGSFESRPLAISHLSRQPIVLRTGSREGELKIVRAGSRTVVDVGGERLDEERVVTSAELQNGLVLDLGHRVVLLLHLHHPLDVEVPSFGMVGESTPMIRVRQEVQLTAKMKNSVLVRGEEGTGKDLLARAIHDAGDRRGKPWVAVNMPAIEPANATRELFGIATPGAEREGLLGRANGGTAFLDEIGNLHGDIQQMLLRTLESGEIQPVGSNTPQPVDLQFIAATDANLEAEVAAGRFKSQLLHRLAGYEIRLPPLRERRSDFGRLLFHFLREELAALGENEALTEPDDSGRPWPPADLVARLVSFDWPGNVRQLKNAARRLAVAHKAGTALGPSILEDLVDPAVETGTFETAVLRDMIDAEADEGGSGLLEEDDTLVASTISEDQKWKPVYKKKQDVKGEKFREALKAHRFDLEDLVEGLPDKNGKS